MEQIWHYSDTIKSINIVNKTYYVPLKVIKNNHEWLRFHNIQTSALDGMTICHRDQSMKKFNKKSVAKYKRTY